METAVKTNTLKDKLLSEFGLSKSSLFGDLTIREKAIEHFALKGIPNRRSEEYKYVNFDFGQGNMSCHAWNRSIMVLKHHETVPLCKQYNDDA